MGRTEGGGSPGYPEADEGLSGRCQGGVAPASASWDVSQRWRSGLKPQGGDPGSAWGWWRPAWLTLCRVDKSL